MDRRRVVITGLGCICATGNNVKEFEESLQENKSGIIPCTLYDTSPLESPYCGQIKKGMIYRAKEHGEKTRFAYIAESMLSELLKDSGLTKIDLEVMKERAMVSAATSVGANLYLIEYADSCRRSNPDLEWLARIPEYITNTFHEQLGISGPCYVNNSACSAGTTAAGTAFSMISSGKSDLAVVAGIEPISEFSVYGFHSLKNVTPGICKPFDVNRDGINIGEAGAGLIFEEYGHAMERNAKIYGEVYGYGIGNDAYHNTSPDPSGEGALRVMKMALKMSGLIPSEIDYINAHGTGTLQNDEMELLAIEKLMEGRKEKVYVNSRKGAIGHCLACAGVIELVETVLSIYHDRIYPMPTLVNPMETTEMIELVKGKDISKVVNYAMSNSFAFGGNASSIVLGKINKNS